MTFPNKGTSLLLETWEYLVLSKIVVIRGHEADLPVRGPVTTVVGMLAVLLAVEPSPGPPGFGSNGPGSCWKHGGRHILDADQCRGLRFGSKDDS